MASRYWLTLWLCFGASVGWAQSDCDGRERLKESELKKMVARADSDEQRQLEIGFAYQCKGDEADAARWYERAAMRGNAVAQTNLGAMYLEGKGVAQDDAAAARYFLLAASAGFGPAQNNLALLYLTGRGVRQSDQATFQWLSRAVANHYYPAYPSNAAQYLIGKGVARDDKRGFDLMLEAAKHGIVQAQAEVAMLYAQGRGTKTDAKKALEWSLKAAKGGSAGAANNVGYFYAQQGKYNEAVQWYRRAAAAGIPEAEYNLSELARAGRGPEEKGDGQRLARDGVKALLPVNTIHEE